MRIAVEQRSDRWLAQVVSVGSDLHWTEHRRIYNEITNWVEHNLQHEVAINGWQFYFADEQDLTLFLLRWQD
jgi:hypothetical protein